MPNNDKPAAQEVWCVVDRDKRPVVWTASDEEMFSKAKFADSCEEPWIRLEREGFRCLPFTLTPREEG